MGTYFIGGKNGDFEESAVSWYLRLDLFYILGLAKN